MVFIVMKYSIVTFVTAESTPDVTRGITWEIAFSKAIQAINPTILCVKT